ncbi:MAG: AMP-binding protein [Oligosphaeraceae bacterium]|nr:AMP-binding protein [Oligosphaeraceae bacterium]
MSKIESLGAVFDQTVQKFARDPALIYSADGNQISSYSYADLANMVNSWSEFFKSKNVKPGDRVVAIAAKSPLHFAFFYTCWKLGMIAVPVCESLGDPELSFILEDSEPAFILVDSASEEKVKRNAGDLPVYDWQSLEVKPDAAPCENVAVELDDVAALIYTSGSTGMPKGVMLTHENLWYNAWTALESFNIGRADRLISLLPYWHAYAMTTEILCVLMNGSTCAIPRDIRDFKRNIKNYKPTIVLVVPRVVDGLKAAIDKSIADLPPKKKAFIDKAIYNASRICNAGPKLDGGILRMFTHHFFYDPLVFRKFRNAFGGKIRFIVSGGAPLDLEHQIFFKYVGMPIFQGYGLTEASPIVSSNQADVHRLGSCGRVMPWLTPEYGGDYAFKDEDGNLAKSNHGLLMLKGKCVMKGYWRHSDASAKTMEDGWLNTGDVGYCDKDGFIFIHGRKGSMIVMANGEKVHPEFVEDVIKTSPMISEAMVIGEKCKNLYVCANVPQELRDKHSEEELYQLVKEEVLRCTGHMAMYQKPKDVIILPDFNIEDGTLTVSLKIRRFKIRERYKQAIEQFLLENGEEVATKRELSIASSKVVESLEDASVLLGDGTYL